MEGLKITKGGNLIKTKWDSKEDKWKKNNVTISAPEYLFEDCTLEDGVTLRDIFLLVEKHTDIFNIVINKWCSRIIEESLSINTLPQSENIEYLELSNKINIEKHGIWGNNFASFNGIGKILDKDIPGWKKGERVPYSLMITFPYHIIDLPVKLNDTLKIYKDIETTSFAGSSFSLGSILYGIFYELTWFGSTENRDKRNKEFNQTISESFAEYEKVKGDKNELD